MLKIDVTLICICIPLILGAPTDDSLKQMSGLYHDNAGYWNIMPPGSELFDVETRSGIDSLGRGNILKRNYDEGSLGLGIGEWGGSKSNGWRFGAGDGGISGKRGGGLDSLGRGNILRSLPASDQEEALYSYFKNWLGERGSRPMTYTHRSLDSLGKGNILKKRSTRDGRDRPLTRLQEALQFGGGGIQKKFDSLSGRTFGGEKRNFDEIDRAGFGSFVKKNFDEFDRNGFGFNKRNFDEIDRTGFGSFVKRST